MNIKDKRGLSTIEWEILRQAPLPSNSFEYITVCSSFAAGNITTGARTYQDARFTPKRIPLSEICSATHATGERDTTAGGREADTIMGVRHSGAIVPLVDRASKFAFPQPADRRTASLVSAAIIDCLGPMSEQALDGHRGQRKGVYGGCGGLQGAQRRLPLRPPVPLVGAGAERTHERAGQEPNPKIH